LSREAEGKALRFFRGLEVGDHVRPGLAVPDRLARSRGEMSFEIVARINVK